MILLFVLSTIFAVATASGGRIVTAGRTLHCPVNVMPVSIPFVIVVVTAMGVFELQVPFVVPRRTTGGFKYHEPPFLGVVCGTFSVVFVRVFIVAQTRFTQAKSLGRSSDTGVAKSTPILSGFSIFIVGAVAHHIAHSSTKPSILSRSLPVPIVNFAFGATAQFVFTTVTRGFWM